MKEGLDGKSRQELLRRLLETIDKQLDFTADRHGSNYRLIDDHDIELLYKTLYVRAAIGKMIAQKKKWWEKK